MKIQSLNYTSPSFTGQRAKFDAQAHIGSMYDNLLHTKSTYDIKDIYSIFENNNVKKVLISDISGLNPLGSDLFVSEKDSAETMERLQNNGKVKLYPLISCQPGITQDTEYIGILIKNHDYAGMKFHPTNTQKSIAQNFDMYSQYMSLALKNGLACVFHSVTDGKSDPEQIIKLAEKYPKLPVVLYHVDLAASPDRMTKTIDKIADSVSNGRSNLYVDLSWITGLRNKEQDKNTIYQLLEKLGPSRILFGSDTPISDMGDSSKYEKFTDFVEDTVKEFYKGNSKEAEKALDRIFYDNSQDIFADKTWYKSIQKIAAQQGKNLFERHKKAWIIGGAAFLGFVGLIGKALYDERKTNNAKNTHLSRVVTKKED